MMPMSTKPQGKASIVCVCMYCDKKRAVRVFSLASIIYLMEHQFRPRSHYVAHVLQHGKDLERLLIV